MASREILLLQPRNRHGEDQRRSLRREREESRHLVGPGQQAAARAAVRGGASPKIDGEEIRRRGRHGRLREPPRLHPPAPVGRPGPPRATSPRHPRTQGAGFAAGALHLLRLRQEMQDPYGFKEAFQAAPRERAAEEDEQNEELEREKKEKFQGEVYRRE